MAAVGSGPLFQGDGDDCQEVELSANDKSYTDTQHAAPAGLREPVVGDRLVEDAHRHAERAHREGAARPSRAEPAAAGALGRRIASCP